MARAPTFHRLARLGWRNQLLLVEAGLVVTIAALLVAAAPFRAAIRTGSRGLGRAHGNVADLSRVAWSVSRVAGAMPWRALCLEQGLAAQWLLRRRGFDAVLHYGIGRATGRELAAHVWVSVDGETVIGGDPDGHFAEVVSYPGATTITR